MQEHDLSGPILHAGIYPFEVTTYLPDVARHDTVSPAALDADTVVVGRPRCRFLPDRRVLALVAANLAAGHLREVHADSVVVVYEVVRPLQPPSPSSVAAQPVGAQTDHC